MATAFVDVEDEFQYVNQAWSRLTGYAASALVGQKNWQGITAVEDVGAGQREMQSLREGDQTEYYQETRFVRANGQKIDVSVYVHRHPAYGEQAGCIFFARPVDSQDFASLETAYQEMATKVLLLEQQRTQLFEPLEKRLDETVGLLHKSLTGGRVSINNQAGPGTMGDRVDFGSSTAASYQNAEGASQATRGAAKKPLPWLSIVLAVGLLACFGVIAVLLLGGSLSVEDGEGRRLQVESPAIELERQGR